MAREKDRRRSEAAHRADTPPTETPFPHQAASNSGHPANKLTIRRDEVEARVLKALQEKLLRRVLFEEFCDEFTREMNRLRMEGSATLEAARSELKRIERELDTLLDLILKGGAAGRINAKMVQLEDRKAELERQLAGAEIPPHLLHPEMATFYREQVSALHEALQDDTEPTGSGPARSCVRS